MNLATLTALAQAATPGKREFAIVPLPGFEDGSQTAVVLNIVDTDGMRCGVILRHQGHDWEPSKEDQAFIAACSPDVILALVARVRTLEEVLKLALHRYKTLLRGSEYVAEEQAIESALTPSEPRDAD